MQKVPKCCQNFSKKKNWSNLYSILRACVVGWLVQGRKGKERLLPFTWCKWKAASRICIFFCLFRAVLHAFLKLTSTACVVLHSLDVKERQPAASAFFSAFSGQFYMHSLSSGQLSAFFSAFSGQVYMRSFSSPVRHVNENTQTHIICTHYRFEGGGRMRCNLIPNYYTFTAGANDEKVRTITAGAKVKPPAWSPPVIMWMPSGCLVGRDDWIWWSYDHMMVQSGLQRHVGSYTFIDMTRVCKMVLLWSHHEVEISAVASYMPQARIKGWGLANRHTHVSRVQLVWASPPEVCFKSSGGMYVIDM